MVEDFIKSVEDGLKLSKRVYFGKDRTVAPPKPPPSMERDFQNSYLPTAPMVYTVISDPGIVDNPDMPSYQPHVYGNCDPPALIPLQMNGIEVDAHCYFDTAFITVTGSWRLHCVMGCRSCDCRIALPIGEQGSILSVEASVSGKSYCTQMVVLEDKNDMEKAAKIEGGFLNPNIFTLTIPHIDGGSNLSVKISWTQKLLYADDQFSLNIPFTFPAFVCPAGKRMSKKEKIQIKVDAGSETELLCKTISHPLKEIRRQAGKLGFSYESEVLSWSHIDFSFSFAVSSSISGGVLLQSASLNDPDQREMFYLYLFPGKAQSRKVFRKDIVFVVDISGSMRGKLLDDTKNALFAALNKLNPEDSFSVLAFNGSTYLFSTSMMAASKETVERAIDWININFVVGDGTNISHPLNTALEMLTTSRATFPVIFLVTDGTVEDERHICNTMKNRMTKIDSICPRIYTFGIGAFCNHYFLQRLAMIGRGHHVAALDVGSDMIESQMLKLFARASSPILTNIAINIFDDLDEVEVFPSHIPDLSIGSPLILSGRYRGEFPETLKARGILADLNEIVIDLKTQKAKDIPLDRLSAKQQIELLTAEAWLFENKQLEQKVAKLSLKTGFTSEYAHMAILEIDSIEAPTSVKHLKQEAKKGHFQYMVDHKGRKMILLQNLGIGFGNLTATLEDNPPRLEEKKMPEAAEILVKAASNCCGRICDACCCMCCIRCCSRINNECGIALTQLCGALASLGCFTCWSAICCSDNDT